VNQLNDWATDDERSLKAILDALDDPLQLTARVFDHYRDSARAERTSRATMYLHLGILSSVVRRLAGQ
jgi:hypothetical protein